jgi:hypothetical protein
MGKPPRLPFEHGMLDLDMRKSIDVINSALAACEPEGVL